MNNKKLVITSAIANSFEWYDYALFGHFALLIGQKFFPAKDPNAVLLEVFLVFAIGYLMRPLGGVLFGVIGDKYGRKTALSAALMCMAIPTCAIGFLPTYEQCGIISTGLMIAIRMLQGLSMGGVLTGSVSFIIEHSEAKNRGLLGSITMSSICIGLSLGSFAAFALNVIFTAEQVDAWAWRLPFIVGIIIYFIGIYIKKYLPETPAFNLMQSDNKVTKSPLHITFANHKLDMLLSILINATGSILFYFSAFYLISYQKITRGFSDFNINCAINILYIIMIFVTLFAGWLSDKIGRRKIFVINLICIIVSTPFLLHMIETSEFIIVAIAQICIGIIAALYIGPEPALQAEFYPTEIRNTAMSVSYNTATSVFGGTAPYIIESIVQHTGTITSAAYYIIFTAILGLISLYFYQDRSQTDRLLRSNKI